MKYRQRIRPSLAWRLGLVASVSLVIGCGEEPGGATVNGIITYKGKPLSEGAITFVPQGKPVAWSLIAADGSYSLKNHKRTDRIEPGTYTAFIIAGERELMPKPGDPIEELPVPVSVTSQATSPLAYEIKPGPNTIDINLDNLPDKPKAPK